MPNVRTRLPGDRILDQAAGGVRWRRLLARSIPAAAALCTLLAWRFVTGTWWMVAVFATVLAFIACVYAVATWCSKNWNG